MQTLATVRKSTKQGLSTWRFVKTEDGQYIAFGGVKPACKYFADFAQASACFQKYLKYGYHKVAFNAQLELPLETA